MTTDARRSGYRDEAYAKLFPNLIQHAPKFFPCLREVWLRGYYWPTSEYVHSQCLRECMAETSVQTRGNLQPMAISI